MTLAVEVTFSVCSGKHVVQLKAFFSEAQLKTRGLENLFYICFLAWALY